MNEVNDIQENYSTGYVWVFRSIRKKGWYKKSEYVHLWIHLLTSANHKGNEWLYKNKIFKINAGQFITSRKNLSLETGINESKIERILKCFEIEQQIEQQNMFTNRLISIINWESYQKSEQQSEQQVNSKRTASEQRVNTNNNVKNVNNDKNDNLLSWRENFEIYLKCLNEAKKEILNNNEWIEKQQRFNPNVNIELSIEKAIENFWGKEGGWKNKKKSKTKEIDWYATMANAISINKVYYEKNRRSSGSGFESDTTADAIAKLRERAARLQ